MADASIFWKKSKSLGVWKKRNTRGYVQLVDGLELKKGELIGAEEVSWCLFGTDLATRLNVLGCGYCFIRGVSTSGCVKASTLDTIQYGYRPISRTLISVLRDSKLTVLFQVVETACGERFPVIHNADILDTNAKMADVVSEEEALTKLKAGNSK
jgi:hypothetical protein